MLQVFLVEPDFRRPDGIMDQRVDIRSGLVRTISAENVTDVGARRDPNAIGA